MGITQRSMAFQADVALALVSWWWAVAEPWHTSSWAAAVPRHGHRCYIWVCKAGRAMPWGGCYHGFRERKPVWDPVEEKQGICPKWHVFYTLLVSHGSSAPRRPPSLCVRWQASATSCRVLAQLLASSLVTTNCFLDVPFIPPRDLSGTLSQRKNSCFPLFCCILYQAVLWFPSCSCSSLYLSLRLQFVLYLLAIRSFELILQCPVAISLILFWRPAALFLLVLSHTCSNLSSPTSRPVLQIHWPVPKSVTLINIRA